MLNESAPLLPPRRQRHVAPTPVARNTRQHIVNTVAGSRTFLIGVCVFYIPQLVLLVATLALYWRPFAAGDAEANVFGGEAGEEHNHGHASTPKHGDESDKTVNRGAEIGCDRPLALWCVVQGVRLLSSLLIAVGRYYAPDQSWVHAFDYNSRATCDMLVWVWIMIGNFWLVHTKDCMTQEPHIYQLTAVLIILQLVVLFTPCVLLFVCAPLLFFCAMPLFIRIMEYFHDPTAGRGAAEEQLRTLPSTTFTAGMFRARPPDAVTTAAGISSSAAAAAAAAAASPAAEPSCAICMLDYVEGEELRILSCHATHHFHKRCIDVWLRLNASCPSCRMSVLDRPSPPPSPGAVAALAAVAEAQAVDGAVGDGEDDEDVEIVDDAAV
jgi:hypothetical protein